MQRIVVQNSAAVADGTWTVTCIFWLGAPPNNIVPRPAFKSRVLNVPADVQAALEAGTLVEQEQVSPLFPADFDLSDARQALEAMYVKAQADLDATNPPVAGLVGTRFDGTSWVNG